MREGQARRRAGDDSFLWRGQDVSRVEGFSDAVFAFAITLLVASLEGPRLLDGLLRVRYLRSFTLLTDQLLGFGGKVRLLSGAGVEMMEPVRGPLLKLIYGGGFATVQLVFVLLYLRDL